ncbi:6-aminohexanoate-dimer hydrolase protein [Ensifer adhaerens OV14]|nr:6-aminohexanoate-dimer hydrolase protein [Ensifer adhaerens OV14]
MAIACVGGWLAVAPPGLLKVGDGYAAKIVCSNVFIAGRDGQAVLADDVQAPGHPLLKFISVSVDREKRLVSARIFGFAAPAHAVYRPGLGCANVSDDDLAALAPAVEPSTPDIARSADVSWPDGDKADIDPAVQALIEDGNLAGPGMRAISVVRDGHLIAETYGAGFNRSTPLLGWSMTKSVTSALIGMRVAEGHMDVTRAGLLPEWSGDARAKIRLADLMGMESGLEFNEGYGNVSDVTRMLYLERDMAGFAAAKPATSKPGSTFSYSSGTSTLLSRLWMQSFDDPAAALAYPRDALFLPLGMTSRCSRPMPAAPLSDRPTCMQRRATGRVLRNSCFRTATGRVGGCCLGIMSLSCGRRPRHPAANMARARCGCRRMGFAPAQASFLPMPSGCSGMTGRRSCWCLRFALRSCAWG